MTSGEEDVLRLDISVYNMGFVGVAQSIGHLTNDPNGLLQEELLLSG